jgi:putative ABC transport system substrate-binding protein
LAAELVRLNVDVIVVSAGSAAVRAANDATKTIPIVMVGTTDPVEFGLIDSLARPGGNVTGVANLQFDTLGKRLQLLKAAAPTIERVVWLRAAPSVAFTAQLQQQVAQGLAAAAKAVGVTVLLVQISPSQTFDEVAAAINVERPDALLVGHSPGTGLRNREIAEFAIKHRLPTVAAMRGYVEFGMLMSYGESGAATSHKAAIYVARILGGAKPADLPVEQPTKFELVLNLKTAKALGLTIPQSVLLRADEVIE